MSFLDMLKEYFQWTENRSPEGFLSWQHLLYATLMVALTVFLAVWLGKKFRHRNEPDKDRVMKIAAITILACELTKIVLISWRAGDPLKIRGMLPLFLCSINLFTIPLAAFAKGKLREFAQDAVFLYGMLCCLTGAYLAANYFNGSPVLSFDPMMSVTTHCIAGFVALYLPISGLLKVNIKKMFGALLLIFGVEVLAFLANCWNAGTDGRYESNYMFLSNSAGTPFEIVNTLVGGHQVLYTIAVAALYLLYGLAFIGVLALIRKIKASKKQG